MKRPLLRILTGALLAVPGALLADPGDVSPAQPVIPSRVFNLMDFGAVPDGRTPDTEAFKRAVAAVDAAGGGVLLVPPGRYFTGPLDLCSRINLRLEAGATILFSPRFADYGAPGARYGYRPLLLASGCRDVEISGSGTIYGSGEAWWPEAVRFKLAANAAGNQRGNTSPRPRMVVFDHCERVRVEGVTLTHAPVFNLVPSSCRDVTIEGIKIVNPADAPNTDGIDPSVSDRVLISHCTIDTGDDCIAVKAGGRRAGVMTDLLVTDCTFLHGHGCSVGSETTSGLRRMVVRRCTFDGTDTGVRLKSDRARGGLVEGVVYEDLTMRNVGTAISISSYYQGATSDSAMVREAAQPVTKTTPRWRGITIRNVTATACTRSAGLIAGLPEMPAEAITLDHVTIEAPKGLRIVNARDIRLHDVSIEASKGPPVIATAVSGLVRD